MSGLSPHLPLGLEAVIEETVRHEWTIAHFDPALPPVFSTPAMIGLMELAAARAVAPALPPGHITVGTRIEVDHLKAAPVGARVRAWARLDSIEGRFLYFVVDARYGEVVIGRGRVGRTIVDLTRFAPKSPA